ncbi:MAG: hypothetical protein ACFCD0_22075 [Gemmataceae bacterium]
MDWIRFTLSALLMGTVGLFPGDTAPDNPGFQKQLIFGFTSYTYVERFNPNEPARVIVVGNGKSRLALYAFDSEGNCVVKDDLPSPNVEDDNALLWYPKEKQTYQIVVNNVGPMNNLIEMSLR